MLMVGPGETYSTISSAMSAAYAGKTVYVRPGTYNEDVVMKTKVDLVGAFADDAVSDGVTINGKVLVNDVNDVQVAGLKITGSTGVNVYNSTNVVVRNCHFVDNTWAISINKSNPDVRHNLIIGDGTGIGMYLSNGTGTGVDARNNRINRKGYAFNVRSCPNLDERRNSILVDGNDYLVTATNECATEIAARRNWWGNSAPIASKFDVPNGIDYSLHLSSDPVRMPITAPKTLSLMSDEISSGYALESARNNEVVLLYKAGRELRDSGDLVGAIDAFDQIVREFPGDQRSGPALKEVAEAYYNLDDVDAGHSEVYPVNWTAMWVK
jgi:hypothetical protein